MSTQARGSVLQRLAHALRQPPQVTPPAPNLQPASSSVAQLMVMAPDVFETKARMASGNKYTRENSSLKPIYDLLNTGKDDEATLQQLVTLMNGLSDKKKKKYAHPTASPLAGLRRAIKALRDDRATTQDRRDTVSDRADEIRGGVREDGKVTDEQANAIKDYKAPGGSTDVNAVLRDVKQRFKEKDYQHALDMLNGMAQLPRFKGWVYRGAGTLIGGIDNPEVGQTYSDSAFLSCAQAEGKAFAGAKKMKIKAKAGFVDIAGYFHKQDENLAAGEDEALGLPGTPLVYNGEKKGWHVYKEK